MLGRIGGRRRRGQQRMRWLDGITDSMDMSLSKLRGWWWTGSPGVLQSMGSQRVGHDWDDWTELQDFKIALYLTCRLPWHQPCTAVWQACSLLLKPITLSPNFAFGYAVSPTWMPSLFLCLYVNPTHPQHLIEFQLPCETSPAHIHLSVLWILLLLLHLLTPILVLNSSPVILCRSVLSPQRLPYIWFFISQPGSALLGFLEGCSDS